MDSASYGILQSVKTWYGAILMGGIALMSIYMMALTFVRFRFFAAVTIDPQKVLEQTLHALDTGESLPMGGTGQPPGRRQSDPPLQVLAFAALANRSADGPDVQELMKVTILKQRERLEKGLSVFGTFAAIGPFLGLLATVLGIIHSF